MHPRCAAALPVALAMACAHPAAPPAPVAFTRCRVGNVLSVDSTWRVVRGAGFSFCVPGSWKAEVAAPDTLDARVWTGDAGRVTWDTGRPKSLADYSLSITAPVVTVPRGSLPPAPSSAPLPPDPSRGCGTPTTTPYLFGSVTLVVTQVDCQGTWTTTAWSAAPAVYVQGVAHGSSAAVLLASLVATMRFSPTP